MSREEAYEYDLEAILSRALQAQKAGARELHIVGGNHPSLPWSFYLEMIHKIHQNCPDIGIKAFTAVEIFHFHKLFNKSVTEILQELKDAGLSSLPGGGAEVFSERVRLKICRSKANAEQWLSVHREAHRLQIPSNATLLFGTVETLEERLDHLFQLRTLQDETGGFSAFIPLAFHSQNNRLQGIKSPGAIDKLKTIAVSRLVLDNFEHIKAYWVMLGTDIASLAQHWGADDLDGTVVEEKIYHMAGARTPFELAEDKLIHLIESEGYQACRRNNLYQEI
jgi:aminodeoxyfutalosine synthase